MTRPFCYVKQLSIMDETCLDEDGREVPIFYEGFLKIEFLSDCDPIQQTLQLECCSIDGILLSTSDSQKFFEFYEDELTTFVWESIA